MDDTQIKAPAISSFPARMVKPSPVQESMDDQPRRRAAQLRRLLKQT
jgi:hypothetical protein